MRVALVSDVTYGGAAIACGRLRSALTNAAADVTWVASRSDPLIGVAGIDEWPTAWHVVATKLFAMWPGRHARQRLARVRGHLAGCAASELVRLSRSDLVNVHGVQAAFDLDIIDRLARHMPLVWTLHDMWAFTGGCAYTHECGRGVAECQFCRDTERGRTHGAREWRRRHRLFARIKERVRFVTPSLWLKREAEAALPVGCRVHHIPNSVDLSVFRPLDCRAEVRRCLGLPQGKRVIMVAAHSLDDPRKGGAILLEALAGLPSRVQDALCVVMVGASNRLKVSGGFAGVHAGLVHDESLLNLYYNAADLYVHASQADNLPNVLVESVATGTPCVCFDVGGCGEVVKSGFTGALVKERDAALLSEAIRECIELDPARMAQLSANCRQFAEGQFSPASQAAAYLALFGDALGPCTGA